MGGGSSASSSRLLPLLGDGPFGVGAVDLMVADGAQGDTGIFTRLFYPVEKTELKTATEEDHPLWIPRKEYIAGLAHYQKRSPQRLQFLYDWVIGERRMPCVWERPLAQRGADAFPLVIFSHGLAGCRHFYSSYCASLASHGYVVAALEHRDYSACWTMKLATDELSGKLKEKPLIHRQMTQFDREFKVRNQQLHKRVSECVKMLHVLEELNLGQLGDVELKGSRIVLGENFDWKQFKGRLDMSRVVVAGHSLGGATALAACSVSTDFQVKQSRSEETFQAGVILDGWLFPLDPEMYTRVTQPLLFLCAGKWQFQANLERIRKFEATPGERLHYTISDGVHMMVSDFTFLLPGFVSRRLGFSGVTPPRRVGDALVGLSIEFLHHALDTLPTVEHVEARIKDHYEDFVKQGPVAEPAQTPTRS